jgi:hypothetical protein
LFVTVAFNCSAAALAAVLDTGFALDDAVADLVPARDSALGAGLLSAFATFFTADFSAATLAFVTFALPAGFTAAVFFAGVFVAAAAFGGVAFAAVFAFFTGGVEVFAGFFIAFAMESTANKGHCKVVLPRRLVTCA